MRSTNVLLLIALVTISYSGAFEFTNLAEVKDLRSSNYGSNLIETISLTLQNSGSIEEVKKMLNDLLYKLNRDQEEADEEWKKTKKALNEKIQNLKDDIIALTKEITEAEAEKGSLEKKVAQGQKNLAQYKKQKADNIQSLEELENHRKNDDDEYKKSIREHNDVINAVDAVITELKKLEGSISGETRPEHVAENSFEKRDRLAKSFLQVTQDQAEAMAFAELATSADQAALGKLITLLEDLRENTKASLNKDEEHEANSKASYDKLQSTLTEDIQELDQNITDQEENLKQYITRIEKLAGIIKEKTALRESKKSELKETEEELKQKHEQYESDKAERINEKEVINRLKKIVKERLENMSKFLKGETGAY